MTKKRLGKGLKALINDSDNLDQSRVDKIFIDQIEANPFQPRKNFDQEALKELAASIQKNGLIQPITVRKIKAEKYQIVAGERRWRASKLAGLKKIAAIIGEFNEQEMLEIALIENIQRQDLNPIEKAKAYKEMLDNFEITQSELAEQVGKSRSNISNTVRLLKLADKIKNYLEKGIITAGHARALLALENKKTQLAACENIIIQDLTVRETEKYVEKLKKPLAKNKKTKKKNQLEPDWEQAASELEDNLGKRVKIKQRKNNNLLTIEIDNLAELKKIVKKLK